MAWYVIKNSISVFFSVLANAVLFPLYLLYRIFDYIWLRKNDAANVCVSVFGIGWGIILFLTSNPARNGWFAFVMLWIIAMALSLMILSLAQNVIVKKLREVFRGPAEMFDSNINRIMVGKANIKYRKSRVKPQNKKTEKKKENKKSVKKQEDAKVTLTYFIEKDKKVKLPVLKYMGASKERGKNA